METIRIFIAVEIPKTVKESIAKLQAELGEVVEGIKWVGAEQIHLTLKFLGNIRPDRVDAVKAAIDEAASRSTPFTLTASGVGAFPSTARARVIWVGLGDDPGLTALHENMEAALEEVGFDQGERPFKAHLTIGRVRGRVGEIGERLDAARWQPDETFEVTQVTVFKSELRRSGALHTPLHKAILGG